MTDFRVAEFGTARYGSGHPKPNNVVRIVLSDCMIRYGDLGREFMREQEPCAGGHASGTRRAVYCG